MDVFNQPVDPDSESSGRLVAQFGGQVHESKAPFDTSDLNVIGKVRWIDTRANDSRCMPKLHHSLSSLNVIVCCTTKETINE